MDESVSALQVLSDHNSEVSTCDISQCNLLATGAGDKTVRVWEWTVGIGFTPTAYSPLPPHKYGVTFVRFSPQGTMLASSSVDGTTVIWNTRTGSRIHTLVQPTRCSVRRAEFTPDSVRLFTAGDDGIFCMWDLLHGSLVKTHRLHDEEDACVKGLALSSDGQLMVTADTGGLIQLWNMCQSDLECLSFHRNVNDGVACCAFSPLRSLHAEEDMRLEYSLATSGCDGVIRIWTITTVRSNKNASPEFSSCDMVEVAAWMGHKNDVHDLRFNSSGALLASIGLDKTLRIWQVPSGDCLQTLSGHTRYGNCCAFSKESSLVVTGSNDRTVIVWNRSGNASLHSNLSPPCTLSSHFSTEHTEQEELMTEHVEEHDGDLELVQTLSEVGVVNSVHFAGSRYLAVAGGDKLLRIWENNLEDNNWKMSRSISFHKYSVNQVAFSPCGSKLLSCSLDGVLLHWDLQTDLMFELRTATDGGGLRCCAFSATADVIATAGDDEAIYMYDSSSMEFVRILFGHRDSVTGIAFSPDGTLLASTSLAGDLIIHNLIKDKQSVCLTRDSVHDLGALACDFASHDVLPADDTGCKFLLASCGNDSLVRVWRLCETALNHYKALEGHGGNVMCVKFSPENPLLLASTATDNTARIWNVKSGSCILVVEHHSAMVNACAFSEDSSLLATGSMDRTCTIWRLPQLDSTLLPRLHVNKRVQLWNSDDVSKWMQDLGHPHLMNKIYETTLTGRMILTLDEDQILDSLELSSEDERRDVGELLWWAKQEAKADSEYNGEGAGCGNNIPHNFLCPITHDIMRDPVLCSDGFTYDRAAITEWMLGGRFTSPMTNETVNNVSLLPNGPLKKQIYRYLYGNKP